MLYLGCCFAARAGSKAVSRSGASLAYLFGIKEGIPNMVSSNGSKVIRMSNAESAIFPDLHRIITCEERVEEAVKLLARALDDNPRRGKKPVLIHSLRVGFLLMAFDAPTDVVIAGILHDMMEKTPITSSQLTRRFGPDVAAMVAATTNDPRLRDPLDRYENSVIRCAEYGEGALLVRASDLIDNCDRMLHASRLGRMEKLLEKLRLLVRVCRQQDVDDRLLVELVKRQRRIARLVSLQGNGLKKKKTSAVFLRGPRLASARRRK